MSILLESLSQNTQPKKGDVPDLHAQHFDDDMLGDEWLIKRVKLWKSLASVLFILLAASWIYIIWYQSQEQSELKAPIESSANLTQSGNQVGQAVEEKTADQSVATQSQPTGQSLQSESESNSSSVKQTYVPQKREPVAAEVNNNKTTIETTATSQQNSQSQTNKTVSSSAQASESPGAALFVEELSAEMQAQFPRLDISSYVVADTQADSFVILDGSFYKVNQVISPNLILREINKQEIILEFHGQKVKLPHQ